MFMSVSLSLTNNDFKIVKSDAMIEVRTPSPAILRVYNGLDILSILTKKNYYNFMYAMVVTKFEFIISQSTQSLKKNLCKLFGLYNQMKIRHVRKQYGGKRSL